MSSKSFQIMIGISIIIVGFVLYIFQLDFFYLRADGLFEWGTVLLLGFIIFSALYFKLARKEFWPFFPAGACLGVGSLLFILAFTDSGEFASGVMFFVFGLSFLAIYLHQRLKDFWPIIPAAVFWGLSALLLSEAFYFNDELAVAIMFLFFALGFIAVYFHLGKKQFWPFIPAGVFLGLFALLLLASMDYEGEILAGSLHLVMGLGFAAVYFFHREHWWALIPGGILAAIGIFLLLLSREDVGTYIGSGILIGTGVIIVLKSLGAGDKETPVPNQEES